MINRYLSNALWLIGSLAIIAPLETHANNRNNAPNVLNAETSPDYKQMINKGIELFERTRRESWAYKVVRFENEEGDITSSTELFTPNSERSKRWTLLELNGKQPTKKQLKKFVKRKVKAEKSNTEESNNHSIKLRKLIDIESLKVTQQNDTHINFGFNVHLDKLGEDAKGKLDGALTYNKKDNFIDTITITNNSEFSPMFSAAITDFKLTLKFAKIEQAILPVENAMEMKGTFAFFTDIEETSIDRFSEYQFKNLVK